MQTTSKPSKFKFTPPEKQKLAALLFGYARQTNVCGTFIWADVLSGVAARATRNNSVTNVLRAEL